MQGLDEKRHNCNCINTHSFPLPIHKTAKPHIAILQTSILYILSCQLQKYLSSVANFSPSTNWTSACLCKQRLLMQHLLSATTSQLIFWILVEWDTETSTNTDRCTLKAPLSVLIFASFCLHLHLHPHHIKFEEPKVNQQSIRLVRLLLNKCKDSTKKDTIVIASIHTVSHYQFTKLLSPI